MADGIPNPNVVLKIGFLNKNVEQNLAEYKVELRAIVSKFGRFLYKQYVHLGAVCVWYGKFDFIGILIDVQLYIQYVPV